MLVVDDDADFREATTILLESSGCDVSNAASGAECMAKVRGRRPDLIVLDVMMSTKLEGFRVSYKLRATEDTARIPIVMVSGVYGAGLDLPSPEECGLQVTAFLDKPVAPEDLLACINGALQN